MIHRIHADSETSAGIKDKRRANEDKLLFKKVWPHSFASVINLLYKISYKSNK